MKYSLKYIFIVLLCSFTSLSFAKPSNQSPLVGNWVNQNGSKLIILNVKTDKITGSFITAVAKHKACIGTAVPVTGFINGNSFSLSMDFRACNAPSTVSMIGKLNTDQLETMFMEQESGTNTWNSRVINHDEFYKS